MLCCVVSSVYTYHCRKDGWSCSHSETSIKKRWIIFSRVTLTCRLSTPPWILVSVPSFLSHICFGKDSCLWGCYTVMTGKYTVHQVTHCNTPDNLNHPQFLVYYTALMTVMNLISFCLFIYLFSSPSPHPLPPHPSSSSPPSPPPHHYCFWFHLSSCCWWLFPCFDKTVLISLNTTL